ncbi:MAG: hypothetical protein ACJ8H8_22425 [Geminicoccaceae bacterium]
MGTSQQAPEFRRFLILFEPEVACRGRLEAGGMAADVAAEMAFYLAQASDFEALVEPAAAAFAGIGVELICRSLDPPEGWLPLLIGPERRHTLLWSLTDGFARYRGSFVASLAALLDVPLFGSTPAAYHLCQDKFRCGSLAAALGFRTPPTVLVENGAPLSPLSVLPTQGPLFVKPNTLGGKLGIEADSRAVDLAAALAVSRRIWERYGDRAVIQAYLPGRDVRVSCLELDAGEPELGIYEIVADTPAGFPTLGDSRRMTRLRAAGESDGLRLDLRPLDGPAAAAVAAATRLIARVAGLRDCYSLDFRIDGAGEPWFLEFEVGPAVTIYDFMTYLRDNFGTDLPGALIRAAPLAFARRLAGA